MTHHKLDSRYTLRGSLLADSAIHVGAGQAGSSSDATDMPVTRDGRGRPYVPGSSLRGALRSGVEALLRGVLRPGQRVCNPLDSAERAADRSCSARIADLRKESERDLTEIEAFDLAWRESCEVCKLFGSSFLASRVRIADLPLRPSAPTSPTYVRHGVGLDRDLRTAAQGILYTFEAVASGSEFELRMEVENPERHEVGLVLIGLDLFGQGFATLGGKGSRGLGAARAEVEGIMRRTAADFFTGSPGHAIATAEREELRNAARQYYMGEG